MVPLAKFACLFINWPLIFLEVIMDRFIIVFVLVFRAFDRSSAFQAQDKSPPRNRLSGKRLHATNDICPEIPLTPRPGSDIAVVASG